MIHNRPQMESNDPGAEWGNRASFGSWEAAAALLLVRTLSKGPLQEERSRWQNGRGSIARTAPDTTTAAQHAKSASSSIVPCDITLIRCCT